MADLSPARFMTDSSVSVGLVGTDRSALVGKSDSAGDDSAFVSLFKRARRSWHIQEHSRPSIEVSCVLDPKLGRFSGFNRAQVY